MKKARIILTSEQLPIVAEIIEEINTHKDVDNKILTMGCAVLTNGGEFVISMRTFDGDKAKKITDFVNEISK
jgi:hypothetical protein